MTRGAGGGTGRVRIISGTWKGRWIATPQGLHVRPTADRVKEAIFSKLQFRVPGSRVVDAFAGTGSLGIEALSRGAQSLVSIELDADSCTLIKQNLADLGADSRCSVIRADAARSETWDSLGGAADLILADPPYQGEIGSRFLEVAAEDRLRHGGVIVLEHDRSRTYPAPQGLRHVETRAYGSSAVSYFEKDEL